MNLTQKQLAALANVSAPTISRFEQNAKDIQLSSALAILDVLGMTDKRTLVFTDTPTPAFADGQRGGKINNLSYSGGLVIGANGAVEQVAWDSPAFAAGLTISDTIVSVNDRPFSDDLIKAEITAAKGGTAPIRLIVKTGDRLRQVDLVWNGGLRYPRFQKTGTADGALDKLLMPR